MGRLTIYKDTDANTTVISNYFIDEYMQDANGAQLKIYLYLVRMMNANLATSISDIADKFNLTEKDVLRALKFWENKSLLVLEYDAMKSLAGIHLLPIENKPEYEEEQEEENQLTLSPAPVLSFIQNPQTTSIPRSKIQYTTTANELFASSKPATAFAKPTYTSDDVRRFSQDEEASQLVFIAEQYIKKTLSTNDMMTLLFIYDTLHFSVDLIDYLLQYCIEKGKKDFRYIEKVALAWAEQHITTPEEARGVSRYDKDVYEIMRWLGKSTTPSPKEREFIDRWTKSFGLSMEVIEEACNRTVMATDTRRFNYCDGILTRWAAANVRSKADILTMDMNYQKTRAPKAPAPSNNKFNQFAQNAYDFDQLEKDLLSN